MTTAEQLIDYLFGESKGVITLSREQAEKIIDIVVHGGYKIKHKGVAKLYRYNNVINNWELIRSVYASDQDIKLKIEQAMQKEEVEAPNGYMWECYNSDKLYEGRIYTWNISLF